MSQGAPPFIFPSFIGIAEKLVGEWGGEGRGEEFLYENNSSASYIYNLRFDIA